MHITLADVVSLNGKITKGDDPNIHGWSSDEDWEHFVRLRDAQDVMVIDRHTYETVRPQPSPGLLRVVLTSHPERFVAETVPGQLEFANQTPQSLVDRLTKEGHQKMLVAGGGRVCSEFLTAGLVHDIYLSFEPVLFGEGKPMLAEKPLEVVLQLESVTKLNDRGTLLAHYIVQK